MIEKSFGQSWNEKGFSVARVVIQDSGVVVMNNHVEKALKLSNSQAKKVARHILKHVL